MLLVNRSERHERREERRTARTERREERRTGTTTGTGTSITTGINTGRNSNSTGSAKSLIEAVAQPPRPARAFLARSCQSRELELSGISRNASESRQVFPDWRPSWSRNEGQVVGGNTSVRASLGSGADRALAMMSGGPQARGLPAPTALLEPIAPSQHPARWPPEQATGKAEQMASCASCDARVQSFRIRSPSKSSMHVHLSGGNTTSKLIRASGRRQKA